MAGVLWEGLSYDWSETFTMLGYVGSAVAVGAVTVGTGGTALVVAGAAMTASTGFSIASTTVTCYRARDGACLNSLGTMALGAIPGFGAAKSLSMGAKAAIGFTSSSVSAWSSGYIFNDR